MRLNFYQTGRGREPAREYIDSLEAKQAQKVSQVLAAIQNCSGQVPPQYFRHLEGSRIYEVRVVFSGNIFRILSFFGEKDLLLLAHGFTKKTQRTPRREIERAEKRRRAYFS